MDGKLCLSAFFWAFGIVGAFASERLQIELPVYQGPTVYEVDEKGNSKRIDHDIVRKGKFAKLSISIRSDRRIPADLEEALKELKLMLPKDYFEFLIRRFGFVPSTLEVYGHRNLRIRFDDRILDLEVFLYDLWDLSSEHNLAKQIDCMGNFEFDLTPVFMLLTMEEMSHRDGDMLAEMGEARILTTTLAAKCNN